MISYPTLLILLLLFMCVWGGAISVLAPIIKDLIEKYQPKEEDSAHE